MRASVGPLLLRLLGGLCAVVGVLAWVGLAWKASSNPDAVTPQSEEGGSLMVWALFGTVLMIVGALLLHVAPDGAEDGEQEGRGPPR
jgi:hypothetical protein